MNQEMQFPKKELEHQQLPSKAKRKRLNKDQISLLELSYNTNQKPQATRRLELAAKLGLPIRQVEIWYQNRRARQKTQKTEEDYKAMKAEFGAVLAEKKRLEVEIDVLKRELNEARQQLYLVAAKSVDDPLSLMRELGEDNRTSSSSNGNNHLISWGCDDDSLPLQLYSPLL